MDKFEITKEDVIILVIIITISYYSLDVYNKQICKTAETKLLHNNMILYSCCIGVSSVVVIKLIKNNQNIEKVLDEPFFD